MAPFGARTTSSAGSGSCSGKQQMVGRDQDLLGVEPGAARHLFERVDRRAVEIGLARLAQAPVARLDAATPEEAGQGRGATVHRRRLDDLGREEARSRPQRLPHG